MRAEGPSPGGSEPRIPLFDVRLEPEDLEAVEAVLRSGWLTMGPQVEAFEAEFAASLGCRHAVALSSCTAALHLAYLCAGVGAGDEVIVPSFTFVATAAAARYCGAEPVFAEIVGPGAPVIDPDHVERLITDRTKAVVAMHYAGYAAPVDRLGPLCEERGIALIEDSAHAPVATPRGLAGAFSFFSNKVLPAGEGGALATDDDEVADRARRLRSQAMTTGTMDRHRGEASDYDVSGLGFNYRIDEPRAALLRSQLGRLESRIDRRRKLVRRYRQALGGLDSLLLPFTDAEVEDSSCYMMPVLLADAKRRSEVRRRLHDEHGVQTTVMYPAVHEFDFYRRRDDGSSLPRTELAAQTQITLPLYPHLEDEQQEIVIAALEEALGR